MELPDIAANFKYVLYNFVFYNTLTCKLKYYNFKLYREENNKLVPIILDRLQSYYTQFCEENEINQSTQTYSNLNSDQTSDDTDAPSPKRRSNSFL